MLVEEVQVQEAEATESPKILYFNPAETELRRIYSTIASITSILRSRLPEGVLFNVAILSDGDSQGFRVISIQGDYASEAQRLFPDIQITHFTQDGYNAQKQWSENTNY